MSKKWDNSECEFLISNYGVMNNDEMASHLNRSEGSIRGKITTLGLSTVRKWTTEENDYIIDNYAYMTTQELSEKIGCSQSKVCGRVTKLGLKKGFNSWTKYQDDILIENYYTTPMDELMIKLNRTECAITKRARDHFGMKATRYWNTKDEQFLIKNINKMTYDELIHTLNRTLSAIRKKATKLNLCKTEKLPDQFRYNDYSECLEEYKSILDGELFGFKRFCNKEWCIDLFKYSIGRLNIKIDHEFIYNIMFSNFMKSIHLNSIIITRYRSYFEFITACYPELNLKQYEFSNLHVDNGYWDNLENCYEALDYYSNKHISAGKFKNINEMFALNKEQLGALTSKTMLTVYGLGILWSYCETRGIDMDSLLFHEGIRFDSREEKSVYIFIRSYELSVVKNHTTKFINDRYACGYIPDFIINNTIIEYYGMYKENPYNDIFLNYHNKTKQKNEYYNSLENYDFIALYPEDLKNNFQGVYDKIKHLIN